MTPVKTSNKKKATVAKPAARSAAKNGAGVAKRAAKPAPKSKPVAKPAKPTPIERGRVEPIRANRLEPSFGTAAPPAPELVPPPAESRGTGEGRYVYGIIESSEPTTFGKTGIGGSGESVYTVHHGDVAAVVSKTSVFIFDPTRENALSHEHVI